MRPQTPTRLSPHVHDHVPRHGLVSPQSRLAQSSSGLPQVDEALNIMARKMDEARRAPSANWSGLVWSSLAVVGLSSMAGLGRAEDQKITTSCQQPGSFHMLSGECPCQLA